VFVNDRPESILDVRCGIGAWLNAAISLGVTDICGIDGVPIPAQRLQFPALFLAIDISKPFRLNRRFDLVICLEVAEHLRPSCSEILIASLVEHGDTILFSAACPNQPGQHHVNCQWPEYWQKLFNLKGYTCSDSIRWQMWSDKRIEPWYRQNTFFAVRAPDTAGKEKRIISVVHPDMMPVMTGFSRHLPPGLARVAQQLRVLTRLSGKQQAS
jgi:hypothetical protein